jgi:hypothetical protein
MLTQDQSAQPRPFALPHPADIAARKALAARPPAPIEHVLAQAEASRRFIAEWRANGRPDLPSCLNPNLVTPPE